MGAGVRGAGRVKGRDGPPGAMTGTLPSGQALIPPSAQHLGVSRSPCARCLGVGVHRGWDCMQSGSVGVAGQWCREPTAEGGRPGQAWRGSRTGREGRLRPSTQRSCAHPHLSPSIPCPHCIRVGTPSSISPCTSRPRCRPQTRSPEPAAKPGAHRAPANEDAGWRGASRRWDVPLGKSPLEEEGLGRERLAGQRDGARWNRGRGRGDGEAKGGP